MDVNERLLVGMSPGIRLVHVKPSANGICGTAGKVGEEALLAKHFVHRVRGVHELNVKRTVLDRLTRAFGMGIPQKVSDFVGGHVGKNKCPILEGELLPQHPQLIAKNDRAVIGEFIARIVFALADLSVAAWGFHGRKLNDVFAHRVIGTSILNAHSEFGKLTQNGHHFEANCFLKFYFAVRECAAVSGSEARKINRIKCLIGIEGTYAAIPIKNNRLQLARAVVGHNGVAVGKHHRNRGHLSGSGTASLEDKSRRHASGH